MQVKVIYFNSMPCYLSYLPYPQNEYSLGYVTELLSAWGDERLGDQVVFFKLIFLMIQ
jgi:hypothetical protein